MKFAHLADTHIRNLKYHRDYRVVFKKIYEILKREQVDYIIHCGDLAHTKTNLSPEYFDLAGDFLSNLSDIAPTYIILGNHDGNLKNTSRQDAITPIISALKKDNLTLLKNSGEIMLDDKHTINVLSVFDRDNWTKPTDKEKINIALYHGVVAGAKTDIGWVMKNGEDPINTFDDFDFVFLGDIHKQQKLDLKGRIRYCGSTIQQNYGESNDKGFLIWDIRDRWDWDCKKVVIEHPRPFVTIDYENSFVEPPRGARLRLFIDNNRSLAEIKAAIADVKTKYKPESVIVVNKAKDVEDDIVLDASEGDNVREIACQEKYLKAFINDIEEEQWRKLFEINKEYDALVDKDSNVARGTTWSVKQLEWDNLFNYGDGNYINFEDLSGIVGILGKNFSGKSSIVDSLLYTIFNTTSKNTKRNVDIINQDKQDGRGKVAIQVGNKLYTIKRTLEKYKKKGKEEARTNVIFECHDGKELYELNGITKTETDSNIRAILGSYEDFHTTAFSSQLNALNFVGQGSNKRKDVLSKFLDLDYLDQKHKIINDDLKILKRIIKEYGDRDLEKEDKELRTEKVKTEIRIENLQKDKNIFECKISNFEEELEKYANVDKIIEAKKKILTYKSQLISTEQEISDLTKVIYEKGDFIRRAKKVLFTAGVAKLQIDLKTANDLEAQFAELNHKIAIAENEHKLRQEKMENLDGIPCRDMFPYCKFITSTKRQKDKLKKLHSDINLLKAGAGNIETKLNLHDKKKIKERIERAREIEQKIKMSNLERGNAKKQKQSNDDKVKLYRQQVKLLEEKVPVKDLSSEEADEKIKELKIELNRLVQDKDQIIFKINKLFKSLGYQEQKYEVLQEEKEEYEKINDEIFYKNLLTNAYHTNGIPHLIINDKIPKINIQLAKLLLSVVDFSVYFQIDEKKLNIYIKHENQNPRPVEMCSGAEKTIIAMAIRLALMNVSSLPRGDIFILDEPGTALDEDNMYGFIRLLNLIKEQFKIVILISHLNSLKDIVDYNIEIKSDNGFAEVSYG